MWVVCDKNTTEKSCFLALVTDLTANRSWRRLDCISLTNFNVFFGNHSTLLLFMISKTDICPVHGISDKYSHQPVEKKLVGTNFWDLVSWHLWQARIHQSGVEKATYRLLPSFQFHSSDDFSSSVYSSNQFISSSTTFPLKKTSSMTSPFPARDIHHCWHLLCHWWRY